MIEPTTEYVRGPSAKYNVISKLQRFAVFIILVINIILLAPQWMQFFGGFVYSTTPSMRIHDSMYLVNQKVGVMNPNPQAAFEVRWGQADRCGVGSKW